jgi:hypothetical protein
VTSTQAMALGGGAGSGCVAVLRWCAAAPQVPASGDEAMPATSRSAVYGLASMTPIMSAPASASGSFAPATDAVVPQRHQWSTNFLGGVQPRSRPGNGVVGTCPGRRPGPGSPGRLLPHGRHLAAPLRTRSQASVHMYYFICQNWDAPGRPAMSRAPALPGSAFRQAARQFQDVTAAQAALTRLGSCRPPSRRNLPRAVPSCPRARPACSGRLVDRPRVIYYNTTSNKES